MSSVCFYIFYTCVVQFRDKVMACSNTKLELNNFIHLRTDINTRMFQKPICKKSVMK